MRCDFWKASNPNDMPFECHDFCLQFMYNMLPWKVVQHAWCFYITFWCTKALLLTLMTAKKPLTKSIYFIHQKCLLLRVCSCVCVCDWLCVCTREERGIVSGYTTDLLEGRSARPNCLPSKANFLKHVPLKRMDC